MSDHTPSGAPPSDVDVSVHLHRAQANVTELVDLLTEGLMVDQQFELERHSQVRRPASSPTDHTARPGAGPATDQPGGRSQ